MIYWAQIRHSRRTHEPSFVLPETHDVWKHPLFVKRQVRLPEERFSQMPSLRPCETLDLLAGQDFPKWVRFEKLEKEVQDFYKLSGWFIVSGRVKAKIEQLEPGIHQFFPVSLLQKDGSEPWGPYHFFHIRQHLFSIDESKSPYFKWRDRSPPGSTLTSFLLERMPDVVRGIKYSFENIHLVYQSSIVANRIIWREALDRNTEPNLGTRWWSLSSDNKPVLVEKYPGNPTKASYRIEDELGFRMAEKFKVWIDAENVRGLDCSRFPGVIDTEWKGDVK